ncbi:MAG: transposase [Candidatus Hydrogenedentes bacterium]|nr:transposase [Candidatus Hydrogenedentota bacterium]
MVVRKVIRKTRKAFNTEGEAHGVTFSCFKRRQFLSRDRTREYFVEALELMRKQHNVHIWAFVIMPEHVHLVLWPVYAEYQMESILSTIKLSVSRKAMAWLRSNNPEGLKHLSTGQKHAPYRFWLAGGGYDRNVIQFKTLRYMVDYTHNNPVRRGLAVEPADWKWSSAREWEREGTGLIRLNLESYPDL